MTVTCLFDAQYKTLKERGMEGCVPTDTCRPCPLDHNLQVAPSAFEPVPSHDLEERAVIGQTEVSSGVGDVPFVTL